MSLVICHSSPRKFIQPLASKFVIHSTNIHRMPAMGRVTGDPARLSPFSRECLHRMKMAVSMFTDVEGKAESGKCHEGYKAGDVRESARARAVEGGDKRRQVMLYMVRRALSGEVTCELRPKCNKEEFRLGKTCTEQSRQRGQPGGVPRQAGAGMLEKL